MPIPWMFLKTMLFHLCPCWTFCFPLKRGRWEAASLAIHCKLSIMLYNSVRGSSVLLVCWTPHKPCQQMKHSTYPQQVQALSIFSNYFQIWSRTNQLRQTDSLNNPPPPFLICYSYSHQELKTLPSLHTADMQRKHAEFSVHVKTVSSGKWLWSLLLLFSGNGVPNCSPDWLCTFWCFIFKVLKVQVNHTYHGTSPILWPFLPWKGKVIYVSFVLFIFTLATDFWVEKHKKLLL